MQLDTINLLPEEIIEQAASRQKRNTSLTSSIAVLSVVLVALVGTFAFNRWIQMQLGPLRAQEKELEKQILVQQSKEGLYWNLAQKLTSWSKREPLDAAIFKAFDLTLNRAEITPGLRIESLEWTETGTLEVGGSAQSYAELDDYLTGLGQTELKKVSFDQLEGKIFFEARVSFD